MPTPKNPALEGRTTDELCDLIEGQDLSLAKIAALWKVHPRTLTDWVERDATRSARAKESRIRASDACDRKAEAILLGLRSGSTKAQVARARELASHYRWQARVRNPKVYGDRQQVEHSGNIGIVKPEDLTDEQIADRLEQLQRQKASGA